MRRKRVTVKADFAPAYTLNVNKIGAGKLGSYGRPFPISSPTAQRKGN